MTLARMKQVDFSSTIFVETTGILVKNASNVRSFSDLGGKNVAVVEGTTNERAINANVKRWRVDTKVTPFKSRDEAIAAFEVGKVDAVASDKLQLLAAASKMKDKTAMTILPDQLSYEPYAIVVPRNDSAMRLAVNTGLSNLFAGGEINEIVIRWFAPLGKPSPVLEIVYALGAIPPQ